MDKINNSKVKLQVYMQIQNISVRASLFEIACTSTELDSSS